MCIALVTTGCEQPGSNVVDYTIKDGVWEIYTAKGLLEWNEYVTSGGSNSDAEALKTDAVLMADITLPDALDGSGNWMSVGFYGSEYNGNFNGNGHTISNLVANAIEGTANSIILSYCGMFGVIGEDGKVIDLTLNAKMQQYAIYSGGIAGNNKGEIYKTKVVGSFEILELQTDKNVNYGGIAGRNSGKIVESSFEGEININGSSNNLWAGGIAGYNERGIVEACCNTGTITAVNNEKVRIEIGGIVGRTTYNGVVAACYNTGNLSSGSPDSNPYSNYLGGVAGYIHSGKLIACYSNGSVSLSNGHGDCKGIVGGFEQSQSPDISSCFWSTPDEGRPSDGGGPSGSTTKVDGTVNAWSDAKSAMNTALATPEYSYRYDESNDSKIPLVIVNDSSF